MLSSKGQQRISAQETTWIKEMNSGISFLCNSWNEVPASFKLCKQSTPQSVSWSLAEFRHNKIVQSPHENYFNVCRQHKEKWALAKMTIIQTSLAKPGIRRPNSNGVSSRFSKFGSFTDKSGAEIKTSASTNRWRSLLGFPRLKLGDNQLWGV